MTKREKMLVSIIIALTMIIIFGLAFIVSEMKSCKVETFTTEDIDNYEYNSIGMSEYKALIKDTNTHIIYIGRPTCSYCVKENPILKEIALTNNLEINYLNIDELTDTELEELTSTHESLEELSTPTILIVKNKNIVGSNVGYLEKSELEAFFQEYGIIE